MDKLTDEEREELRCTLLSMGSLQRWVVLDCLRLERSWKEAIETALTYPLID